MANVKHVGKMKTGQRVVVLFRTVPNEPHNCLVTETQALPTEYHNRLMELVESEEGQQSGELADLLSRRFFSDGTNVLNALHAKGFIKKVGTKNVLLTPNTATSVPLNEVNDLLSTNLGKKPLDASTLVAPTVEEIAVTAVAAPAVPAATMAPGVNNSKLVADMLEQAKTYEEWAARLRDHAAQLSTDVKTKKRGRAKAS
jgi:hypothetical protein